MENCAFDLGLSILQDRQAPRYLFQPPSSFALNKLKNFQYVELWYFTKEAIDEVAASDFTVPDNAVVLTDGTIIDCNLI